MHWVSSLASAALLVAAQQEPESRQLRRAVVGGWTVTDTADGDGGRLVELARDGRTFSLRYHANFWRGNGGERRGTLFAGSDCSSGDGEAPVDPDRRIGPAELRRQFAAYFAECALSPSEQERVLAGLDRAYCLFDRWAADAGAQMANENARIAAYGTDETPAPIRPDPPAEGCG